MSRGPRLLPTGVVGLLVATLVACSGEGPTASTPRDAPAAVTSARPGEPVHPLPDPHRLGLDPAEVQLGRALFKDTRLSADGTVSCATCHDVALGGADNLPRSVGIGGALGEVNAPTVLNASLSFRQFWDGRAETLEDQIDGPVQNPLEMGAAWADVVAALSADRALKARFERVYPERGLQVETIKRAIATYERALITADSPFDRWLRGDDDAISAEALAGYERFKSLGCVACHQGAALGGNMFQRFGVMRDYFADRGDVAKADLGRFNVTGREEDRHRFKVPTLRNVARTPPYFHDASAATLPQAVAVMAQYQLGVELSPDELTSLVAFLESLSGSVPDELR